MWEPQIQVFDERKVKDNFIAYFEQHQRAALLWANGGVLPLEPFKDFHTSGSKLVTRFPSLSFLQTEHKSSFNDLLIIEFSLVLEAAISHGDQDTLTELAPKYAMVLESMLVNAPETTFNQDSIIQVTSTIDSIETAFDVQGKLKTKFIQIFQTKCSWQIEASAYE